MYYPKYETEWSKSGCTNAKPKEKYGTTMKPCLDRPCYETAIECCKGAYAGQTSGACMEQLPEGERPTAAPTGIGGPEGWYGGTHGCYGQTWGTATCQNKKLNYGDCGFYQRNPSVQSGDSHDTKLECCDAAYGGQFSNLCYAWATKCASGNDVCADYLSTTFDASVGCDSCGGDEACLGATGSIGITGPYCRNSGSCLGTSACDEFGWDTPFSTENGNTPAKVAGSSVGRESCLGEKSCYKASGKIADESCIGNTACLLQAGTIGSKSCIGDYSCTGGNFGTIGDLSCTKGEIGSVPGSLGHKPPSCASNSGTIGHGSCTEHASCIKLDLGKRIGNGSWYVHL